MKNGVGRNFSNQNTPDGDPERFFSVDEVSASIEVLRVENARGWNVFITPIDPCFHYIVVDDVPDLKAVSVLKELGYSPCLVQRSSKDSIQCILKITKIPGKNEQHFANAFVVAINNKHGDKKFQGVVHPFRLAGFSNKKSNRNNEFTQIIETNYGAICNKATAELSAIRTISAPIVEPVISKNHTNAVVTSSKPSVDAQSEYKRLRAGYEHACQVCGWNRDESLIDFKCAKIMAQNGYSEPEISAAILMLSPGLETRHPELEVYANKVAKNAFRF